MAAKRNASGLSALPRPSLDNEELVSRGLEGAAGLVLANQALLAIHHQVAVLYSSLAIL